MSTSKKRTATEEEEIRARLKDEHLSETFPDDEPGPHACPKCGSVRVRPIAHGSPTPETEERSRRGEVALGGCMVFHDERDPALECRDCGNRFGAYNWKNEKTND